MFPVLCPKTPGAPQRCSPCVNVKRKTSGQSDLLAPGTFPRLHSLAPAESFIGFKRWRAELQKNYKLRCRQHASGRHGLDSPPLNNMARAELVGHGQQLAVYALVRTSISVGRGQRVNDSTRSPVVEARRWVIRPPIVSALLIL